MARLIAPIFLTLFQLRGACLFEPWSLGRKSWHHLYVSGAYNKIDGTHSLDISIGPTLAGLAHLFEETAGRGPKLGLYSFCQI